jgi:anti-anti-sigma regulatory factor
MTEEVGPPAGRSEIRVVSSPAGIGVALDGDLDDESARLLAEAVAAAADAIEPAQWVDVDLRAARRMTPSGLHVLAMGATSAKARHRRIRLRFAEAAGAVPRVEPVR